jgi:hypothetical protein
MSRLTQDVSIFEVSRIAVKGEWIKIVGTPRDLRFKNGEIYQVASDEHGTYVIHPEGIQFGTGYARVYTRDYVVLMTVADTNRQARRGEWIVLKEDIFDGICKAGDIKEVKKVYHSTVIGIDGTLRKSSDGDGLWSVLNGQYLILESYKK